MGKTRSRRSCSHNCTDIEASKIQENCDDSNKLSESDKLPKIFDKTNELKKIIDLYEELLQAKEDIIKGKDTIIKELNEKIIFIQENRNIIRECAATVGTKLYSEAIHNPNNKNQENFKPNQGNHILIKPTNPQDNKTTRKELGKIINPAALQVEITKIENLRNGSVKIECNNKEQVFKIQNEAKNKLGPNYTIKLEEKKITKIKIIGIDEDMDEKSLIEHILEKNDFLVNPILKVITIKKMKSKYMAILEIDAKNFKIVMEKGFLFIDFSVCSVFEYIDIMRCFKCTGYNHTAKYCTKKQKCLKCGKSDHKATECKSNEEHVECPNCSEENLKNKSGFMINHSPFNINCESYKLHIERAKRKINYNEK